jgi:TonB family protein
MSMLLLIAALVAGQTPHPPEPIAPETWITPDDYPVEAMQNVWDGRVGFSVMVTPQGAVGECSVTQSSGHAILDEATCDTLRSRAHFKPALDINGRPVSGTYSDNINWMIPNRGPVKLAPLSGQIEFDVDAEGKGSNCRSTIPDGFWPNLSDLCTQFEKVSNIEPIVFSHQDGPRGTASRRHVMIHFDMKVSPSPPN